MDDSLTIQQVAQRTGLSIHTLRYYEHLGLLISVHRLPNGHRRYDESAMPISEMQRFAEITRQGTSTASERRELLEAHRLRVVAQLQEIQHQLSRLDTKIAHLHALEIEQEQDTEKAGAKL